ncbi:hypothetical protein [Aeromonas media]|uniref:hypothetical protein n=1 Tax=Aeromonas media TaxID=651 RepID=UPI003D2574D2
MKTIISFDSLFVFSESKNCCFYDTFISGANIISGRNTSGKSSLIQSLLFTFGINDVKESLSEILDYSPTFRIDFTRTISGSDIKECFSIVRETNSIYIKEPSGKIISFYGVDADNSAEHIKLKEYIRELIGFNLYLEQKGELKTAPLESMFLPYYISQSVGWVYLRESFSNLQYYKGFKDDYLDYYLGINNNFDRVEHRRLTKEKERLTSDINNLKRYSKKSDFIFATLVDETFGEHAEKYIEQYIIKSNALDVERHKHIKLCNELSLLQNHHKILKRTKQNIKRQNYNGIDRCPACTQILSYSLEGLYSHYQKYNDTVALETHISEQLTQRMSTINSTNKKVISISKELNDDYGVLLYKQVDGITFQQWIETKASISLYKRMQKELTEFEAELKTINEDLASMITEQTTISERKKIERVFENIFSKYTSQLSLKNLTDTRYLALYKIHSFPRQGVELHKTVMAYHFALNEMIRISNKAHRLPFLLDAILKEDIDNTNLELILSFVGNNLPQDTQSFISISEHVKENLEIPHEDALSPIEMIKVKEVKNKFFPENSKLLYIGDGMFERSFLSQRLDDYQDIHLETIRMTSP